MVLQSDISITLNAVEAGVIISHIYGQIGLQLKCRRKGHCIGVSVHCVCPGAGLVQNGWLCAFYPRSKHDGILAGCYFVTLKT